MATQYRMWVPTVRRMYHHRPPAEGEVVHDQRGEQEGGIGARMRSIVAPKLMPSDPEEQEEEDQGEDQRADGPHVEKRWASDTSLSGMASDGGAPEELRRFVDRVPVWFRLGAGVCRARS